MNTPPAAATLTDWRDQFASAKTIWPLGLVLVVLAGLFLERILVLGAVWMGDPNYSHGFLIIPISVWIGYRNLVASKSVLEPECWLGFLMIAVGCLFLVGTTIIHFTLIDFLALALILRGGTVAIGGRTWASAFTFPIFFLFFMFPLPIVWTNFASVWLQDWVSWISGRVLELFFICHQQGNMILLAGARQPIYVAQECSGLRQLVAFLALAVLMGHLSKKGIPFGILLVIAAVPIAIFSNVLRVLLMAVVIRYLGAASLTGWIHDVPALVTLPIGLLCFFGVRKILGDFFATRPVAGEVTP